MKKFYKKKYYISGCKYGEEYCDYFNNENEFLNVVNYYLDRFYTFGIHSNSSSKWEIYISSGYIVNEISEIDIIGEPPKYMLKFLEQLNKI